VLDPQELNIMPLEVSTTQNETGNSTNYGGGSVTNLVSGIISDAQRLMEQQANLLKTELRRDMQDAKETGTFLVIGGAVLGTGSLLLLFMLVHLLSWLTENRLPLWGSFGIVGGLVAVVGGIVFYRGQQKLQTMNPLPEQTAEAMKENLQWKTNPN